MTTAFQRARRPEQVAERRDAILAAARRSLDGTPVADVTLTALAAEAGLAKSNVLRYFDSREAVLLDVLTVEWEAWADAVEARLGALRVTGRGAWARERAVCRVLADELLARPLLCELMCAMASVLEHNVGAESALAFKTRSAEFSERVATLLIAALPGLGARGAAEITGASVALVAGLWSYAHPTEAVRAAHAAIGDPPIEQALPEYLRSALLALVVGVRALEI
jgi:AcrR family transcriptional regulator